MLIHSAEQELRHSEMFLLFFFTEYKACQFVRIICLADDSHECQVLFSLKNSKEHFRMLSVTNLLTGKG